MSMRAKTRTGPRPVEGRPSMVEKIASILDTKGHGIYSVPPEATVHEALSMMAEKTVGAVLVLRAGKLAGIVSAIDFGHKVVLQGRSARETPVREIMTTPVVTVAHDAGVFERADERRVGKGE